MPLTACLLPSFTCRLKLRNDIDTSRRFISYPPVKALVAGARVSRQASRPIECRFTWPRTACPTHARAAEQLGGARATGGPDAAVRVPPGAQASAAAEAQLQKKGTLFGAIALITGSTVGAGMLALPAVTAPVGLAPTAASLCSMWVLLTLEALLIAEVNIALHEARGTSNAGSIITLRQMAEATLGSPGKSVTLVYLALSYSLLVAYMSKAAEVIDYFVHSALVALHLPAPGLPPALTATAFVAGMAALFQVGGPKAVDRLNQCLTSVLLVLFLGILGAGASQSDVGASLAVGGGDWGALGPALPIVFLSLVYHDLVPVLVNFLAGDRRTVRSAIVMGSIVPLAMFLSWEAVALSLVPGGLVADPALGAGAVLEASLHLASSAVGAAGNCAAGAAAAVHLTATAGVDAVTSAATAASDALASSAAGGLPGGGGGGAVPVAELALDGPAAITVDPLEVFVRRSGPLVGATVEAFSFLAVMTSFTGTTLSLSETLTSEVPALLCKGGKLEGLLQAAGAGSGSYPCPDADTEQPQQLLASDGKQEAGASSRSNVALCGKSTSNGKAAVDAFPKRVEESSSTADAEAHGAVLNLRGVALALTLGPPLAACIHNPDSFLGMLTTAGAYGMTVLYGILPPLMAWQLRTAQVSAQPQQEPPTSPAQAQRGGIGPLPRSSNGPADLWMVPGGRPVLAGMLAVAVGLELSRLAADMGVSLGGPMRLGDVVQTAATAAAQLLPVAAPAVL